MPKNLYVVLCENGSIFIMKDGRMAVFANDFQAEEVAQKVKRTGSSSCDCNTHRVEKYIPAGKGGRS